jgi:hypothetical protein
MMIMLNTQECVLTQTWGGGRGGREVIIIRDGVGSKGGGRVNYLRRAIVDAVEPTMREHQQMNSAKR